MEKLSLKKTLVGAFILPWWYRAKYLKALLFPFFVGLILLFCINYTSGINSIVWTYYFILTTSVFIYPIFAISCHRIVLSEFINTYKLNYLKTTFRIFKFVFWIIVLGIIQKLICYPFSIFTFIAGSDIELGLLPALYVISRLSLVFPSTAIDQPISLSDSWKKTKGVGWKMFTILFLFPSALFIFLSFLKEVLTLTYSIIYPIIIVIIMFEITALSLAYQQLIVGKDEPDNKLQPTAKSGGRT